MSHKKFGRRVLCLCVVAALSLMAFSAAAAQAATPEWKIAGVTLKKSETITGVQKPGTEFNLESKVGKTATPISIKCKKLVTDGGKILGSEEAPAGSGQGTLLFSECVTFLSGAESKVCKPVEPITATTRALLILHEAKTYILFEPLEGENFTEIKFGAECALVPTTPIKGSIVLQCLNASAEQLDCAEEQVEHTVSPAPASLFPSDVLKFGANPATLTGSAILSLSGANTGAAWSGI